MKTMAALFARPFGSYVELGLVCQKCGERFPSFISWVASLFGLHPPAGARESYEAERHEFYGWHGHFCHCKPQNVEEV